MGVWRQVEPFLTFSLLKSWRRCSTSINPIFTITIITLLELVCFVSSVPPAVYLLLVLPSFLRLPIAIVLSLLNDAFFVAFLLYLCCLGDFLDFKIDGVLSPFTWCTLTWKMWMANIFFNQSKSLSCRCCVVMPPESCCKTTAKKYFKLPYFDSWNHQSKSEESYINTSL